MRTAILLSGHMRTFDVCLPTLLHHVVPHFGEVDFFVSTVRDADAPKAELLLKHFPASRVHIETVDEQPVLPLPPGCPPEESWQRGACFMHEPYAISVPPQAILRQLWQLARCWILFGAERVGSYNLIIRARPDSYYHSFRRPLPLPISGQDHICGPEALTPWWGRFGGLNDRFALLTEGAAEAYFTTYYRIEELVAGGCPLHPESLLAARLRQLRVRHRDNLCVEFTTLKMENGHLAARPPEISLIDLAHLGAHR